MSEIRLSHKSKKKDKKTAHLLAKREQKRKDIQDVDEFIKMINGMVL